MTQRNDVPEPDPKRPDEQKRGFTSPTAPAAAVRKRRRWPWIAGGALALLVILVALLPSVASTVVGRALVVSQVNGRLNGRLEIKDWSLGWFSGISVDGIVINDAANRQILQLPHFGTKLGLLGAIRGKYNIGETRIEGLDVLVSREADGSLNWDHLAKGSAPNAPAGNPPAAAPAPELAGSVKTEPPAKETKLPGISGELIVSGARITYEDATHRSQPLYLRNVQASVKISDINQPITDSFSAEAQIGSEKPGTVSAEGTIAAIANNSIQTSPKQLDQTIKLAGLELSAVSSLLGRNAAANLTGRTDGQVVIHLAEGNGTADAAVTMAGVNVGQALKNDAITFAAGATYSQGAAGRDLRIKQLMLADSQGSFSIQKSAGSDVVAHLPGTGSPSAQGGIDLAANLKTLNDIAQALAAAPITARDPNGYELQSGKLAGRVSLAQAAGDEIALTGELRITQLTVGNASSAPLKDQTITISMKGLANRDLSKVTPELHASGDLITADASAELNLAASPAASAAAASRLQKLQKATVTASVPSLPKVQALLRSFSRPKAATPGNLAMRPGPAFAAAGPKVPGGAIPKASPTPAPADEPQMDVTSGTAVIKIDAGIVGQAVHVVPHIAISNVELKRGEATYAMSSVNVSADINVVTDAATIPPPASRQEVVASGNPPRLVPGIYISKSSIDLNELSLNGKPYPEKQVHAGGDISLFDLTVGGKDQKTLSLKDVILETSGTKAATATIQGIVSDLSGVQAIDGVLTADLSYDAGELLKLVVPLLSADLQQRLKDATASGKYQKRFEISGAYPAAQPFNEAVRQLVLKGGFQLDSFEGAGVSVAKLDLPIMLYSGFLRIIYPDKPNGQNLPPAAGFNGGTLNLGGCQVDLREPTPTLSTVGNMKLIDNAGLNPVFAAWSLGTMLDNPMFVGADKAMGYLTITVVSCDRLPLNSTLTTSPEGSATLDLSIRELTISNNLIDRLASVARFDSESVRGDVPRYRIIIHQGVAEQDLTMTIGQNQRPLRMFGKVRLADQELMPLTFDIPWKLFGIKGVPRGLDKALPDGIQIPLTGKLDHPQIHFDFKKFLANSAAQNPAGVIPGIIGGGDGGSEPGSATQPAGNDPVKSIQDLLDQALKKKKKK